MTRSLVWGTTLIILLGAAILAGRVAPGAKTASAGTTTTDPVLARCRAAGEAALGDAACRQAWDGARARFFGRPAERRS